MRLSLARRIVGFYPPAWRARYETELLALVEAEPATLRSLMDLIHGCSGEWWRTGTTSSSTPTRVACVLARGLARLLATAVAATGIVAAGALLAEVLPPEDPSTFTWRLSLIATLVQVVALMRLVLPSVWRRPAAYAVLRPTEAWLWIVVLIVCSALRYRADVEWLDAFFFPFVFVSFLWQPSRRDADLEGARLRLASAQAALEASRRVLWHLDDYQRLGRVTDGEFEATLADELSHLDAVKRARATIARLRSW